MPDDFSGPPIENAVQATPQNIPTSIDPQLPEPGEPLVSPAPSGATGHAEADADMDLDIINDLLIAYGEMKAKQEQRLNDVFNSILEFIEVWVQN